MNSLIFIIFFVLFSTQCFTGKTTDPSCKITGCNQTDYECSFCGVLTTCMRIRPLLPTTQVKGLPFNKYSWLTTHNSFAFRDYAPLQNQENTITEQLNSGIRGLMLDLYTYKDDIWVCHNECYWWITSYVKARDILEEIRKFLEKNKQEIVTIFIEDHVTTTGAIKKVFQDAGLEKFQFPQQSMPGNGEDWPTVDKMTSNNWRLVIFTSSKDKETRDEGYIAYQWKYVIENQYGNEGLQAGHCKERNESLHNNWRSRSLFLMNHFGNIGNILSACHDNSSPLMDMMNTCHNAFKRWPNFIAVDFYKRSDGGGASDVVGYANGRNICGCNSTKQCQGKSSSKGLCG